MESAARQSNPAALSAMICGIIACSFNLLVITAFLGVIFGIVAIVLGAVAYKRHPFGKAGLVLGLLSFVIVSAYLFSYVAIKAVDPFI